MVSRFSFFKEVSEIEPRYSIFDRGLLAAFVSERKWKELIIGNCVTLFKSGKQCDYNRQQRQLAFFNEFVADLIYIIEKKSPTPVHSIKVDVRILIYVFGKAQNILKSIILIMKSFLSTIIRIYFAKTVVLIFVHSFRSFYKSKYLNLFISYLTQAESGISILLAFA